MDHYAGIDVSLEQSSICIVDATGQIVREAKVDSEPEALITFLRGLNLPLVRIGLEAGPLSQCGETITQGLDATRPITEALQLRSERLSDSLGHHDSAIMDGSDDGWLG
jgi:hypothetical protein